MEKGRLTVPASTSNLGPGFDTLGLALDWPITAEFRPRERGIEVSVDYIGPEEWRAPLELLLETAGRACAEKAGRSGRGLELSVSGEVPLVRGLGSSAAYRLAAAAAMNRVMGSPLSREQIIELVCSLEGHTDNTVPCMAGGLTISGWDGDRVRWLGYPVSDRYRFVAVVPEDALETKKARDLLPKRVQRDDAVFNMQRALWLVCALADDHPMALDGSFDDRLHQPHREKLLPFLSPVIKAARAAGAYGGFLSGAGSTVIAVTDEDRGPTVEAAMMEAMSGFGAAESRVLHADNRGLRFAS